MSTDLKAISLFSSAGLGELGLRSNGIEIIAASEIRQDRAAMYEENFAGARMFHGDIWDTKGALVEFVKETLCGNELFLVYATPPCQGMSTNGVGKLNAEARVGNRSGADQRNRLVVPAMDVICKLRPRWVLFENVSGMKNTVIDVNGRGRLSGIVDYIAEKLGREYVGRAEVVSCSDYGIPQIRKRLITIFTRDPSGIAYYRSCGNTFFPATEKSKTMTLRDAIGGLPALDGTQGKECRTDFHPLHYVNCLSEEKYRWLDHTPPGETAYNNQCANPSCRFDENLRHVDQEEDGRWQSSKNTPIYCQKCGELLPRPTMVDPESGCRRLISGFHSAYRRMPWDQPARTLTRNFPFEASDNKIHPDQNRTLSVYEATVIQTISEFEYEWKIKGEPVTRSLIAQAIGESVPPKLIQYIARKMCALSKGNLKGEWQSQMFETL
jgi:DNA (cytosine-5)-methyltransferase 1